MTCTVIFIRGLQLKPYLGELNGHVKQPFFYSYIIYLIVQLWSRMKVFLKLFHASDPQI